MGLEGGSCPSPQGKVLRISGQNFVEAPASLWVPVLSGRMIQSTGPGAALRKVKLISVQMSFHYYQPTQDPAPLFSAQLGSTPRVCHLWAFLLLFSLSSMSSCLSRASLRWTCGFFFSCLFIYLAAPGLSCSTRDLCRHMHAGSLVVACGIFYLFIFLVAACGI